MPFFIIYSYDLRLEQLICQLTIAESAKADREKHLKIENLSN